MTSRINQIGICSADHRRSTDFYSGVFALDYIFSTNSFRGELPEMIQGIKNAASSTHWLIDDRKYFQLEIFQFETPAPRPLRTDHKVSDQGYNRIIVAVRSIAHTTRLAEQAGHQVTRTSDSAAATAHAWLKDPDGILIELVELPELIKEQRSAQLIGLGLTTPNLELSVEDMCTGFTFETCDDIFEHGRYWGEGDELEKHQTLQLGDMFLVVSQYRNSRSRPEGYTLADTGIMNFATMYDSQESFMDCYERTQKMGMRSNSEPKLDLLPDIGMVYNNDRQGFSVEMIFMNTDKYLGLFGFARPSLLDRIVNFIAEIKARLAYPKHVRNNP